MNKLVVSNITINMGRRILAPSPISMIFRRAYSSKPPTSPPSQEIPPINNKPLKANKQNKHKIANDTQNAIPQPQQQEQQVEQVKAAIEIEKDKLPEDIVFVCEQKWFFRFFGM